MVCIYRRTWCDGYFSKNQWSKKYSKFDDNFCQILADYYAYGILKASKDNDQTWNKVVQFLNLVFWFNESTSSCYRYKYISQHTLDVCILNEMDDGSQFCFHLHFRLFSDK